MATLKTVPIRYKFIAEHKKQHIKYAVPAIYSLWEGFVKTCLSIYVKHLSNLNINRSDISINILTHYLDTFCKFGNPRTNFDSKVKIVEDLDILFVDVIELTPDIPTESNVNFKVLNGLLKRFCITMVDDKYQSGLNRLLLFRNKISHGENAIKVEENDVSGFIKLIEDIMWDVLINIQDCEKRGTYKRV